MRISLVGMMVAMIMMILMVMMVVMIMMMTMLTCPPDRKTTPGTAGGMVRENARTVARATLCKYLLIIYDLLFITHSFSSKWSTRMPAQLRETPCLLSMIYYLSFKWSARMTAQLCKPPCANKDKAIPIFNSRILQHIIHIIHHPILKYLSWRSLLRARLSRGHHVWLQQSALGENMSWFTLDWAAMVFAFRICFHSLYQQFIIGSYLRKFVVGFETTQDVKPFEQVLPQGRRGGLRGLCRRPPVLSLSPVLK